MANPQSALSPPIAAAHHHAADENCPYCEQPIPNDRAEEIRAKFDFKQRQAEAVMKTQADRAVAEARAAMEAEKVKQIEKLKVDAATERSAAVVEAKRLAEEVGRQQVEALTAQREAANAKIMEAEEKRQVAVNQYEGLKAQTEAIAAARAAEAREALQKDNEEKNKIKDAEHAAAMQKMASELAAVQRKLNGVEGEGGDIDIFEALKEAFPKDELVRLNKKDGADILHTVKFNKKECGKIVYDSRSRKIWQDKFGANLYSDKVSAEAVHAILSTFKFPKGGQQVHAFEGVVLVHPSRLIVIADLLRDEVIRNFSQRMSDEDRTKKTMKLYDFITSEQFGNVLASLDGNVDKLEKIEMEERKRLKKVSEDREKLYLGSRRLQAKLRLDVGRIVGTEDDAE